MHLMQLISSWEAQVFYHRILTIILEMDRTYILKPPNLPNCGPRCTTANVLNDLSTYWMPALYRKIPEGGFQLNKLMYANT
jgi:hypothetical protein